MKPVVGCDRATSRAPPAPLPSTTRGPFLCADHQILAAKNSVDTRARVPRPRLPAALACLPGCCPDGLRRPWCLSEECLGFDHYDPMSLDAQQRFAVFAEHVKII